jgi:sugar/nucleoside kinase (ribokinase family)
MSSQPREGIACGGNWTVDLIKVIDYYPQENTLSFISGVSQGGGGCGHNVVISLARFDAGLPIYAVGLLGDDEHGEYLVGECLRYPSVNVDQLRRTKQDATSYTDVYTVKGTARRTFFHYEGANRLFAPDQIDLDALPVRMFHLGYLLLLKAMDEPDPEFGTVAARFLERLQARNIRTSIDLVSVESDQFQHRAPPALSFTDYCIINDWEAEKLTGVPLRVGGRLVGANLREVGDRIFRYGVRDLIVIHFPEGAYLRSRAGVEFLQPSLDVPDGFIVGSAGAGDSFCAGILYGLYHGWPLEKTLRFATCAGGLNLSHLSTTGGIKSVQETLRMEEQFAYRKDVCLE